MNLVELVLFHKCAKYHRDTFGTFRKIEKTKYFFSKN